MSNWVPPDIAAICPDQIAPLTQCSQVGFMYLTLLSQLFGRPTISIPSNPYGYSGIYSSGVSSEFGSSSPSSSGLPQSFKTPSNFGTARPQLGPIIPSDVSSNHHSVIHSHGPKGSRGYTETSSFFKPDEFNFQNDFGRFPKFSTSSPTFDFNFLSRSGFSDSTTADSEKVPVREEKNKNEKSRKKRHAVEEYDFIVVGAGSAGCVVANRLSEVKKWKVLLLEAGPEEPDVTSVPAFAPVLGSSSIDWRYRTQPEELTCRAQRGQSCAWFRGMTMGGSSAINYMIYMRGNRRDYDGWAELGNHGWSYTEVLPYFKKAENNQDIESHDKLYHAVGGPLNVERFPYTDVTSMMLIQAFREKGLPVTDFNGKNQLGVDSAQTTSLNGRRMSVNYAYIRPIRNKRPNLNIVNEAFVTKILIDPITKVAYGVQYVKNGLLYVAHAKKEVVLSSGALNSPKILMLSGVGPKYHLESLNIPVLVDLNVGRNLQDHVTTDSLIISLSNKTATLVDDQTMFNEIYDYHSQYSKKSGPLAATGTLCSTAFIKTQYSLENAPDIQYHFDGRNVREFYSDPTTYLETNIFPLAFYDGLAARPLLLTPKSRGYLLLNQTDPVFGQPLIYPGFFTDGEDISVLLEGIKFAVSMENTAAFKLSGAHYEKTPVEACAGYPWGTDDYFICLLTRYTSTIYHPTGTCKMGPKWDRDAVVDPRLRVYGIRNLRVVDASIMPLIVRGNTNAPTIMIGEKASDMIKEEWIS